MNIAATARPTVSIVSVNQRLIQKFADLCDMLCYELQDITYHIMERPDLVIIDAVNTDDSIIRVRLSALPVSVPLLWIRQEGDKFAPKQPTLYNPFTMQSAVKYIQHTMNRRLPTSHSLSETFTYNLLIASSPGQVLQTTASFLAEEIDCQSLGILRFEDDADDRWIFWHQGPSAQVQSELMGKIIENDDLPAGWFRTIFVSGDLTGVMLVQLSRTLNRSDASTIRDASALCAKALVRELAMRNSQEQISRLQAFEMMGRGIVAQLERHTVLKSIVSNTSAIIHCDSSILWVVQQDKLIQAAHEGDISALITEIPLSKPAAQQLTEYTQPTQLAISPELRACFPKDTLENVVIVPLIDREHFIGLLQLVNLDTGRNLTRFDEWQLRTLASWSIIAMTNANLHDQVHIALERERMHRNRMVQLEKVTALGQLVASVAHEVNNPLQIAQASVDLIKLRHRKQVQDGLEEHIETIQHAIDQIGGVIQRIRSNYQVPQQYPEMTDINELTQQTVDMMRYRINSERINLSITLDSEVPIISCFEHEMRQVILNLIQNAVDAIPNDGDIHVRTRFNFSENNVEISVCDSGVGIQQEMLDSIFDIFFTTKNNGSGLGLAVSRDIVVQHGGTMSVESLPGEGTCFMISLPAS